MNLTQNIGPLASEFKPGGQERPDASQRRREDSEDELFRDRISVDKSSCHHLSHNATDRVADNS
jgi:hypothetical protein